jgi:hypothetical protein
LDKKNQVLEKRPRMTMRRNILAQPRIPLADRGTNLTKGKWT